MKIALRLMVSLLLLAFAGCPPLRRTLILGPESLRTNLVVFDVDGTLTPTVFGIQNARPDAANAVKAYAQKGYKILYLTTRYWMFQEGLPQWLRSNGFPEGDLQVPISKEERELPFDLYKVRVLKDYLAKGWSIAYAYGDSSTDFLAYAAVGVPQEHVYALRRIGDAQCQPGVAKECLPGWGAQLGVIRLQ